MIADTYGIPLIEGLEPERLSDDLRDSPIVEGIYNLGVVWRDDGSQSAVRNVINDLGKHAPARVEEFDTTALAAFMSRDDRPVASMPQLVAPGPLNEAQEAVIDAFQYLEFDSPSGVVRMAIAGGHQAIQDMIYGVYHFNSDTGQSELVDRVVYAAECVNPPEGAISIEWIKGGFEGAQCD
jgi:hypothetical protein